MASPRQRLGVAAIAALLPRGGALPERVWQARHRGIVVLLWVHVAVLVVLGVVLGEPLVACLLAPGIVAACTVAAMWGRLSQALRAMLATLGLLLCSAILIGLFDGLIEAHFHFFVSVAVVSLYQSWSPYLLAVGYVLTHHLVLGTLMPHLVYNHHMAHDNPWLFALVHGGAVLAESVACLVFWRVTEDALDAERANRVALERTNAELTTANSTVEDLVAMLSHDLRIPVSVLIGYSEMALESWPQMTEAQQVAFVHKVSRAGHGLNAMLEDTLAVSVLDGHGIDPKRAPVRVDEAVRETLAVLPGSLPDIDLQGLDAHTATIDPGHLSQVLTNLLTNAIKYGGGLIAVSTESDDEHVLVRVADYGPGVPVSFVPYLFDRFTRADEARQGGQNGTGLGLYITRSLLLANGGDITYEPTPDGGATFCLHLPREAARTTNRQPVAAP